MIRRLAYTHTWTLSESLFRRETVSVEWIELIRKAHGGGCCPPALTKAELLSNRKLKNSCNADPPLQAVVLGLGLSPVWTPATEKQFFFCFFLLVVFLAFALAYFIFPWPLIRDLLQQVQKPRRFSFFQLLYLYCKLRIGNMHEDDKLHNRRIQSFRGSKNHHAAILWSAYLHAIFRQADI